MKKEIYVEPQMDVIYFETQDVITTSDNELPIEPVG